MHPYAVSLGVPDALWEYIAHYETGGFPSAIWSPVQKKIISYDQWIGDGPQWGGYSYGMFQMHVGDGMMWANTNGQGNTALKVLTGHDRPWTEKERSLLLDNNVQARYGMPPIAAAWNKHKNTFDDSYNWWITFLAESGHPGGGPSDPVTIQYAKAFLPLYNSGIYGTITRGQGSTGGTILPGGTSISTVALPHTRWIPKYMEPFIAIRDLPSSQVRLRLNASADNEGGVDWTPSPNDKSNPIIALADGQIIGAGAFKGGRANYNTAGGPAIITTRVKMPDGSTQDLYYQHILLADNIKENQSGVFQGQSVKKGDVIGYPNLKWNIEMGFNANWYSVWGGSPHPGPWITDPRKWIDSLLWTDAGTSSSVGGSTPTVGTTVSGSTAGGSTPTDPKSYVPLMTQVHSTLIANPGFTGIAMSLDEAEQFPGYIDLSSGPTDVSGIIRSVGATIGDNFLPFVFRLVVTMMGLFLLIMLAQKAIEGAGSGGDGSSMNIGQAAQLAALA